MLLIKNCAACAYNFMDLICQVACSPYQSEFMWADMDGEKPDDYTEGSVPALVVQVSEVFAKGMYDSCKNVHGLLGLSALPLLCGTKDCSPSIWLEYIGGISNGQAPFPINYKISSIPMPTADGTVLDPLNMPSARCNFPVTGSSEYLGELLKHNLFQ